jgi:hypothetical protein
MKMKISLLLFFIFYSCNTTMIEKNSKELFINEIICLPDSLESIFLRSEFYDKTSYNSFFLRSNKRRPKRIINFIKEHFPDKKYYIEKSEFKKNIRYRKSKNEELKNKISCSTETYYIKSTYDQKLIRLFFDNCGYKANWRLRYIVVGEPYDGEFEYGRW